MSMLPVPQVSELPRLAGEAVVLLENMRSAARQARDALHSTDLDALMAALEERDRLQPPLEAMLAALLRARDAARPSDAAAVEELLAQVRDRAERAQAEAVELEIALITGRQEVTGELERLDSASARSGMYRTGVAVYGGSIDLTR